MKSVKFTCSSRSTRASQSPNKVEKQPKSTPDMYNPPRPSTGVEVLLHTHMDIHCGCYDFILRILRRFSRVANNASTNAFYVLAVSVGKRRPCFFTLSRPAVAFCAAKLQQKNDIRKHACHFLLFFVILKWKFLGFVLVGYKLSPFLQGDRLSPPYHIYLK